MKADYRPRTLRGVGFWLTMALGSLTWFASIFWMLLHTVGGAR